LYLHFVSNIFNKILSLIAEKREGDEILLNETEVKEASYAKPDCDANPVINRIQGVRYTEWVFHKFPQQTDKEEFLPVARDKDCGQSVHKDMSHPPA